MSRDQGWRVPSRGEITRGAMVRAGVHQLLELGWASLTVRSVAARAGVSASLVVYHFGGVGGFRRAVLAEAVLYMLRPALRTMTAQRSVTAGVAAVLEEVADAALSARPDLTDRYDDLLGDGGPGPEHRYVLADVVVAAMHDAVAREVVQESLELARLHLLGWLEGLGVPQQDLRPAATLVLALVDGLLLHHELDPRLPLVQSAALLRAWGRRGPPGRPGQSERSAGSTSVSNSSMPLVS